MSAWPTVAICRDETCSVAGVHTVSFCTRSTRLDERAHHRPLKPGGKPPWKRDDPSGLMNSVARATSKHRPTHFSAIVNEVVNDYGTVSERTVYRYLKKLVERGQVIKLDLRLGFAAYIRPKSKLLNDLPLIREIMVNTVDLEPDAA